MIHAFLLHRWFLLFSEILSKCILVRIQLYDFIQDGFTLRLKGNRILLLFLLSSLILPLAASSQKMNLLTIVDREGMLAPGVTDTVYARVLPNEELVMNIAIQRSKEGATVEVQDMDGNKLFEKENFKNLRKSIPLNDKQSVVRVLLKHESNKAVKTRLNFYRKTSLSANSILDQNVYWKEEVDTVFKEVDVQVLLHCDTISEMILKSNVKVHSMFTFNENESCIPFELPENTIQWCYYIEVDQDAQRAYEIGMKKLSELASPVSRLCGGNPLVYFMLSGVQLIPELQSGEDIEFEVLSADNAELFRSDQSRTNFDHGLVINAWKNFCSPLSGKWEVCFENDNVAQGVSVDLKIVVLKKIEKWGTKKVLQVDTINRRKVWFVK